MANAWIDSIKHCLRNLTRFSGRDRPVLFWPYAGTVVVVAILTWYAVGTFVMRRMLQMRQPDGSIVQTGNNLFLTMMLVMAAVASAMVVLLGAAAVRRLHDRGSSGWWAALPMFFLLTGFIGMGLVRRNAADGSFPTVLFTVMGINNIAYMISLIVLIVFLAWSSEPRDNRFGPRSIAED